MKNKTDLKNERPENLQYKSKVTGEWITMRSKDPRDGYDAFKKYGYEIRRKNETN